MNKNLLLALALNACALTGCPNSKPTEFETTSPRSQVADTLASTRDAIKNSCHLANGQFSLTAVLLVKSIGDFFITDLTAEQKACVQRVVHTSQSKDVCEVYTEEKDEKLLVIGICK